MSTEYEIANKIYAAESSCKISIGVERCTSGLCTFSPSMTASEFRAAIIKLIEALSYISDDPEEVLKRFNVDYGEEE